MSRWSCIRAAAVLLFVATAIDAATVRSQEFCFTAWFPSAPVITNEDRVTAGGRPMRVNAYLLSDGKGGLQLVAMILPRGAITGSNISTYLDGVIRSHAQTVGGTVISVKPLTYKGLTAREFVVEWTQKGSRWRGRNIIAFGSDHAYVIGAIFPATEAMPARATRYFEDFRIDQACLSGK